MASDIQIDGPFNLDRLEGLKNYLASIRVTHFATMVEYVAEDRLGFCHQIAKPSDASLASTTTCVSALVAVKLWDSFPLAERTSEIAEHLSKRNKSAGLLPNNPFSLSFVVEGLLDLAAVQPGYAGSDKHAEKIKRTILPKIKAEFARHGGHHERGSISIEPYPPSAYLTQLAMRVFQRCGAATDELNRNVHRWARTEINKQIALITAKSRISDPMQLAYALILAATTLPEELNSPEDQEIFRYALRLFFDSQSHDGSWPLSRPMFHYRDVGNAYCFEYELLTQLLQCKPLQEELLSYLPKLELAARLLAKTKFDLDPEAKKVGWASGHHPQLEGPESWSSASVYHFAHSLNRLVAEAIRRSLFEELRTPYPGPPGKANSVPTTGVGAFGEGFLDADLDAPDAVEGSLIKTLADRFVFPLAREASIVASGGKFAKQTVISGILFGPPGTSKTELAKIISDFLNWPLLSVDPSYLVQEGLDRVQAMANRLFRLLSLSEQVVVLLDEFDEMGRDRTANSDILSRFITTAMLPKLADINKKKKIVFLLATNYVGGFDAAFARSGRFDMRLQVMPPSFPAKVGHWPSLASLAGGASTSKPSAQEKIAELTYLETANLVRLWDADTSQNAGELLDHVWKNCTLQKPLEHPQTSDRGWLARVAERLGGSKNKSSTWAQSSEADRQYILIPPPHM